MGIEADSHGQNEQTVEVTLGPKAAFENNSVTRLSRQVPANRVVSPVPPSRRKKAERKTATREVRKAALLQKAAEWRRQLDAVEVASQAEIARREGITRARVTQVLGLLRLAPEVKAQVLECPRAGNGTALTERSLRPIYSLRDPAQQSHLFATLIAPNSPQ